MPDQGKSANTHAHIHDEDYQKAYDPRNIDRASLIFTDNRPKESLNGLWRFTADPYDTGLRSGWHTAGTDGGDQAGLPWDYDADGGDEMPVPSCWNLRRPEYFYYEGSAWYAREFSYRPEREGERVFLRVGAANYDAKVFLNGRFLGNHRGGSTPFCVELTGAIAGRNLLQICVNNDRAADRVPMRNTDWFNYGGIYREVDLYRLPAGFIKGFRVCLVPDGTYRKIRAEVAVDGPDGPVGFQVPELGVDLEGMAQGGVCTFEVDAGPELWSPANPRLYQVAACYGEDRVSDTVGFRQIEAAGERILLNGKPVFLRGICVHEDDAGYGKFSDEADIRRRFTDARELGCNFLRLAHYPHHELAARVADETGIMLWEEIPVYWAIEFADPRVYRDAENQLLELVARDWNRASVIIWSVGNENADTDERLTFMGNLAAAARAADPTRLVSAACLVSKDPPRIADRLAAHLDVIGLNEYYGWYDPDFGRLEELLRHSAPGKPVIISETGADALAGHHGTRNDLFTEEYQEYVYERQIELLSRTGYIQGMTPWILYDFRAPRRQNRYQQGWNRKGLIAADKKTRKRAFFILQDYYWRRAEEEAR